MKKNILTTSLLLFSIFSNSQTSQVSASKKMIHPTFSDTTAANTAGARQTANIIFTTSKGIFYRNNLSRWILVNDSTIFASKFVIDTGRNNRLSAIAGKFNLNGSGSTLNSAAGDISFPAALHQSTGGGGSGNRFLICNGSGNMETIISASFAYLLTTATNVSNGAGQATMLHLNSSGVTIGSGSTAAAATAALEVRSTTKGLLLPRLTTTQRDLISSPPAGLIIYNTTTNKLNVYTTAWEAVTSL